MKRITVVIFSLLCVSGLYAQQNRKQYYEENPREVRTLFGPEAGNGGYGAITLGYTEINDRNGLMMGGRGAWVIGHGLGLGIGGYGIVSEPEYNPIDNLNYSLAGGYGGIFIEPIILGRWPVHLALPVLVGAGGVALTSYDSDFIYQFENYDSQLEDAALFFVVEPGVELEFNLVRFIRLSLFGSYRYTTDLLLTGNNISENALLGWSAGVTMKIGAF